MSPPYTSAGFGLERLFTLMIQWELGFLVVGGWLVGFLFVF